MIGAGWLLDGARAFMLSSAELAAAIVLGLVISVRSLRMGDRLAWRSG